MKNKTITAVIFCLMLGITTSMLPGRGYAATGADYQAIPPFITSGAPPLVMLVMGRNHKLYYEAYNDASDLNGDGVLDIRYKPDDIDYYGYFDSFKCYTYDSTNKIFEPSSKTPDKKCSGSGEWSGDFLNYLTMSRMDTMRKVLYGGYRSTDTTSETVLERVFIPQDAHSWAKVYKSPAVDGYDIADYTPFRAPTAPNLQHLFGSTTLKSPSDPPLLRVALNNPHKVWEWASKQAPVLDNSIETQAGSHPGHPQNHAEFETMVQNYAHPSYLYGTGDWLDYSKRNYAYERFSSPNTTTFGAIDGGGNPWGHDYDPYHYSLSEQNNYLAIFTGTLQVTTGGTYTIAVNGDDAVEVIIDGGTTNEEIIGYYGGHGPSGGTSHNKAITLNAGDHTVEFRMEENGGGDRYYLYWNGPDSGNTWTIIPNTAFADLTMSTYRLSTPASTIDDYEVRVKVCDPSVGIEANCKMYPDGTYKPIGLLQRHGESKRMYFGLVTGSWAKSTSGGVLRKQMSDIRNEIDQDNGIFWSSGHANTDPSIQSNDNGIIQTINKMRIFGYSYSRRNYNKNCGWITSGPMQEGQCRDWGNPVAEMIYEAERYFAGKKSATPEYDYTGTTTDDYQLGLPKSSWNNPYDKNDNGFDSCAKPFVLVLSDINPTFDADLLPGANFGSNPSDPLAGLDVTTLADTISNAEGISGDKYIGQSGTDKDGACTAKSVSGFGTIRGLCPEEPTKGGGYYSAAVSYFGHTNDLQPSVKDEQKTNTYAVALASPLPRIELNVGGHPITLVPFAKTIGSKGSSKVWNYWPTNTIVDFYVQDIGPTSGKFMINYEDVEQGADHDMDDIVTYEYQLIDASGQDVTNPALATDVKITLTAGFASGSYIQHAGYIISGTTKDGSYLEVTDSDTSPANDFLVFLDTPPGWDPISDPLAVSPPRDQPGDHHNSALGTLPLTASRVFHPSSGSGSGVAQLLKGPLWYAAKWGAFEDKNGNNQPDLQEEWDKDKDGVPDTYYYVTNPLRLEEQLNKSFADILNRASSGTAASVISNTRSGEGAIYQSVFYPSKTDSTSNANTVNWVGQVHALLMDAYGNMREDTNANDRLDVVGPDLNGDGDVLHEDINMNCVLDTEDTNHDGNLDPGEDLNGNGKLDTEDLDGDGVLDVESSSGACVPSTSVAADPFLSQLDAVVEYVNGKAVRYYDVNGNGVLDPAERIWNVGTANLNVDDIRYLWNSSDWLNDVNLDPDHQRAWYMSDNKERYIFTWIDRNTDGIVDSGEVQDFIWPYSTPPASRNDLEDTDTIYPYLTLYPTFGDKPSSISSLSNTDFETFLLEQTKREISWIRGQDFVDANGLPVPMSINGSDIPGTEMRSRRFNGKTWRLGDIAYSTPTLVGRPAEAFHLLYRDRSYADFAARYQDRRNVVYAGANDGMLHAFNGGFFDSFHNQFCREIASGYNPYDGNPANDVPCAASTTMPELGAELWAYVPYNLLPHLYWLTQTNYGHVYYVDQKPRIFDAKIFQEEPVCASNTNASTCIHPHGWGTVMVVGMRFGGGLIQTDVDRDDQPDSTRSPMKSAFIVMDITNPEEKPKLLAELVMPEMGYSTNYPSVVAMKDGGDNKWFLALGSGPADKSGDPDKSLLHSARSFQKGKFYFVDLVKLATDNELWSLDNTGTLQQGLHVYTQLEKNSFVSSSVTVDYNLDYSSDVLYYGTVNVKRNGGWGGRLHRIVMDNDPDTRLWDPSATLINVGQPITAAPTVALDNDGRNWVFFGTGRFFVDADKLDKSRQSFYGIKEPVDNNGHRKWTKVQTTNLLDVTDAQIIIDSGHSVSGVGNVSNWNDLLDEQKNNYDGWYIDFKDAGGNFNGERNLGQAALIGGLLSFTTFIPSDDICVASGESNLWALYYKTGTAFYDAILGTKTITNAQGVQVDIAIPKISLGQGLATSPSIHTGREKGSVVFVQSSTGEIKRIEEENPLNTKSGRLSWRLR